MTSGTDFTGLELWYEQVVLSVGQPNVNVSYLNESSVARTTGVQTAPVAPMISSRMFRIPLTLGDKGISGVTGVVGGGATVGSFNLLILRRLGGARSRVISDLTTQDFLATGMPQIWEDSALITIVTPDSTSTGTFQISVDIASA